MKGLRICITPHNVLRPAKTSTRLCYITFCYYCMFLPIAATDIQRR